MKAIETKYRGRFYRSRTEARWAVVFDEAGLDFEYELQGYNLQGHRYLPDFWLTEPEWWVEIKGGTPTAKERELARLLMLESGRNTYIFCGQPANARDGGFAVWSYPALGAVTPNESGQMVLQELAMNLALFRLRDDILDDYSPDQVKRECEFAWDLMGRFHYALDAGRSARFEHGQKGAPRQWGKSYRLSTA